RKARRSDPAPESSGGGRKATGEALTGAHAGQPSSCEIMKPGVPTLLVRAEGNTTGGASGKPSVDPAQSKNLCMRGNSSHGNREVPQAPAADGATGRPEKVIDHTSGMYACGKSDGRTVPGKLPNKGMRPAEAGEGRRPADGNSAHAPAPQTQTWPRASS